MKKAIIFAPFWRQTGHVGNYRVDRFVRWLSVAGFDIVLVRAGSVTVKRSVPWGVEITVQDPLSRYRNAVLNEAPVTSHRLNKLLYLVSCCIFTPDSSIRWARNAAKNPIVLEQTAGASFILSSSPPESSHVGAAILAKKMMTKLIIDMRDGWLDEPLKPLLRYSRLQQFRESKLEKRILQQADKIFVTSPVWKSLLQDRLPFTQNKTIVLTNGYPAENLLKLKQTGKRSTNEPLKLIHAGRFTGSRLSQKVSYLLKPLLLGLKNVSNYGLITLLGKLDEMDLKEVIQWQPRFKSKGWEIKIKDAVPRNEMMNILNEADGLLLLSASHAAIPSKLFEYLPLKKPILAVTRQSSAVWGLGSSLEQIFLTDHRQPDAFVAKSFISACKKGKINCMIPNQFKEKVLSEIFINSLARKTDNLKLL